MINRVVLVGRLTRDPDLRVTQNNISISNFNLAINRPFTDQNGERGADFINCIAFRKIAENVNKYVKKGSLVGVDGRIQTRNYENKEGQRIYVTEVVADSVQFLEPKGTNNNQSNSNSAERHSYSNNQRYGPAPGGESRGNNSKPQQSKLEENPFQDANGPVDIDDDDLPF